MSTTLAKIKQLYFTTEASAAAIAKQGWYSEDTRRLGIMEADGTTNRYFWDSTRLADQTTSYGTAIIGTPGITGITPAGGSSGAAATLQAMLTGLANKFSTSISGTTGNYSKFTAANAVGDGFLLETGNFLIFPSGNNGPTLVSVQNSTSGTASLAGVSFASDGSLAASIYLASSALTNTVIAGRLHIASGSAATGINLAGTNATDTVKTYFGTPSSTTVFHTVSNKGIKLQNISLTTEATGTIAGFDHAFTITKNDANSRQFYGYKIVATLNPGGSNASTTIDLIAADTVNTGVTGLTVNPLNLSYGGSSVFRIDSAGAINTPSLNNHYLPFQLAGKLQSSPIYWDDTNLRLGISITPASSLHITQDTGQLAAFTSQYSSAAPSGPLSADVQYRMYMINKRLAFEFNDGGTTRYLYINLDGTGTTWTHGTSAP